MTTSQSQIRPKENVWSYPRPPAIEKTDRHLKVIYTPTGGEEQVIAETRNAYRILETSHPPTYYFPPSDSSSLPTFSKYLTPSAQNKKSFCEWKGVASYFDFHDSDTTIGSIAWVYHNPTSTSNKYIALKDYVAFYATPAGRPLEGWKCYVDGEEVKPQPGDFYGGWMTSDIEGDVKGGPGTWGW